MSDERPLWRLRRHVQQLAIARLEPGAAVPPWAGSVAPLFSATWSATETSMICPAEAIPPGVTQAGPFHAFELEGPLDFSLTGVLSSLLGPLAQAGVSIFTVSTFDTDWILVPTHQSELAVATWREHGHAVRDGDESSPGGLPPEGSPPVHPPAD